MGKKYILCVDDEKGVLSSLKQELKAHFGAEYAYEVAESGEEALEIAQDIANAGNELPVVISDQLMPGMKGDEFLVQLHQWAPKTRKILLTGQASAVAVGNALNKADLFRFLSKPWSAEDITLTVDQAIRYFYMDQRLESQNRTLQDINRFSQLFAIHLQLEKWAETVLPEFLSSMKATKVVLSVFTQGQKGEDRFCYAVEKAGTKHKLRLVDKERIAEEMPIGVKTKVIMSKKALHEPNVSKSEWKNAPYIKKEGTKALICYPISKGKEMIGFYYFENTEKANSFDEEHVELLDAIVSQSALALDNVLLYASLEERIASGVSTITEDHANMRDSITYASRIQASLLPSESELQAIFPQSFVFYKPKDVLSGDFYWAAEVAGVKVAVVADCTGHGVPGALVSMLGLNLLNQCVLGDGETNPAAILSFLHREVIATVPANKNGDNLEVQEGMDVSIAALTPEGKLRFAGAKRPALLYHNSELIEIEADRFSVGDSFKLKDKNLAFTLQEFDVSAGTTLYMFSDGLQDQFGAGKKKFSLARLRELVVQAQKLPISKQANTLRNRLAIWQKDTEQTDDICVVGIQF